jgi:hypothetical protein
MEKKWLENFICSYQMEDTKSCDSTIERLKESTRWNQSQTTGGVNLYSRHSDQIYFEPTSPPVEHEPILLFAQNCLDDYCKARPEAGAVPPFGFREGYNILRYKPGEAYHATHSDGGVPELRYRHVTLCVYLNNVESGGETEFPNQNLKISPQKGKAIIFPAHWAYQHRSLPASTARYVFNIFYGFLEQQ